MQFIESIQLRNLLSFPPDMEPLNLRPLSVLIGPNGSGKSNLIEVFELLRAMPFDFADAIRHGGGAAEWLWKGEHPADSATVDLETGVTAPPTGRRLRYRIKFTSSRNRVEVLQEVIEGIEPGPGKNESHLRYQFHARRPVTKDKGNEIGSWDSNRLWKQDDLLPDQSVLVRREEPELHPEVTWIGDMFRKIQVFRGLTCGAGSALRAPQRADDPSEELLPDARNFALVLNEIQNQGRSDLESVLKRVLPCYERISTRIVGGTVEFYLHERGLNAPIPSKRISTGTLQFLVLLAALFAPTPPSLLCLEEPERGLHPDAVLSLGELLVEASNRMQIVVVTHADNLLSRLNDNLESVLVCENIGFGTKFECLNQARLAHWLKDYTLGDIWRIGEIGGNP